MFNSKFVKFLKSIINISNLKNIKMSNNLELRTFKKNWKLVLNQITCKLWPHNNLDLSLLQVAVKIIDIREIKEKYVVKNLHREARIMSTLNHPCIASLFETMQVGVNEFIMKTHQEFSLDQPVCCCLGDHVCFQHY